MEHSLVQILELVAVRKENLKGWVSIHPWGDAFGISLTRLLFGRRGKWFRVNRLGTRVSRS